MSAYAHAVGAVLAQVPLASRLVTADANQPALLAD